MDDIAAPNKVENQLVDLYAQERLQDAVDEECASGGRIEMWPEHWEAAGGTEIWRCPYCGRLYLNPKGPPEQVTVYAVEQIGLPEQK
jgi:hypothetical protein